LVLLFRRSDTDQQEHAREAFAKEGKDRSVELAAGFHDAAVSYDKAAEYQQPYRHEFFCFHDSA